MNIHAEWLAQYGYAGLFTALGLGILGVPVPEETILTFSGYLAYKGTLAIFPTCAVAFLGSICGITVSYTLGRTLGFRFVKRFGHFIHVGPEKLDRVRGWFARRGKWLLTIGYFIPGVRHLTAIVAGASRLPIPVFALFAYTGALLWSQMFVWLGYRFGEQWDSALRNFAHHRLLSLTIVTMVLAGLLFARWRSRNSTQQPGAG